jgi:hypothetical protein
MRCLGHIICRLTANCTGDYNNKNVRLTLKEAGANIQPLITI